LLIGDARIKADRLDLLFYTTEEILRGLEYNNLSIIEPYERIDHDVDEGATPSFEHKL
jgi:hypothetical protein